MSIDNRPPVDDNHVEDDQEQYIESTDILAEVPDDGDHPMDDEDEFEVEVDESGNIVAGGEMDDVVMEDNSIRHFPNHNGSVFAVSSHPTQPIVASGGEDDLGYIWDVNSGEVIQTLNGHSDSVTSTAFSSDGELLATGGMDGKVRVWKRQTREDWKNWELLIELQGPDEVMVRRL
jgi:ribosome assembly protein SQT1